MQSYVELLETECRRLALIMIRFDLRLRMRQLRASRAELLELREEAQQTRSMLLRELWATRRRQGAEG